MKTIEFTINTEFPPKKIIEIATDYQNISKFFPTQLKCKVLEEGEDVIIEEKITISKLRKTITQITKHSKLSSDKLKTEVLSGPAKGTIAEIVFKEIDHQTVIKVSLSLKLGLQYKLLGNIIKNRYHTVLHSFFKYIIGMAALTQNQTWSDSLFDAGDGILISLHGRPPLKFFGWWYSDLQGVFLDNTYDFLPIKDRTVVDLGANIADSTIFFAVNGAKKVIGVEAFPFNYDLGIKNINVNNLSNKIDFLLAAVHDEDSKISINTEIDNGYTSFRLHDHKGGTVIPTITLKSIIEKYNLQDDSILKLDCEGCEYKTILSSSPNTLQKFSHILIEYHYGYKKLITKLENSNFKVDFKPVSIDKLQGYIFATRK